MAKRSKEASKLAPYLGGHSGAPVEGSFAGDLQAVINALNAHKLGDDHEKFGHVWAGVQQFLKTMVTTSILPLLADSYDIGSDTRRFRKGFFSELSSLVFKKDNVIVLDGRLLVSKMAGVLPSAVLSTDTSIDFGETMIPGDILVMRSDGQMEYIQVGALVSGTTYTVTRDLDGSGANNWPEGEPFAVLGSEGDGWIEISAVDEKRFSVFVMGSTFNSAVEIARYGEITGWQAAGFSGVGLAFGNFAARKYLISTDVNGMAAVGLSLKIGTGEKDIDLTGIQIDDTEIVGQENGVDQVVIGADGKLTAGGGSAVLDADGITLNSTSNYLDTKAALVFKYASQLYYRISGELGYRVWHYMTAPVGFGYGLEHRNWVINNNPGALYDLLLQEGNATYKYGLANLNIDLNSTNNKSLKLSMKHYDYSTGKRAEGKLYYYSKLGEGYNTVTLSSECQDPTEGIKTAFILLRSASYYAEVSSKIDIEADEVNVAGTFGATNISTTPTPNYIPKASALGKLHADWLPDLKTIYVDLSSAQTIAGIKTFSSIPVLPASNPTTDNQAARKAYADTKVGLSGNETVAGVKTFSSIPVLPASNPTTDNQAARKAYADSLVAGAAASYSPTITGWSGTPSKAIHYSKSGKILSLNVYISGTSNSATTKITLPSGMQGASLSASQLGPVRVTDNGVTQASPGMWVMDSGGTEIVFYKNYAGGALTASGSKMIAGRIDIMLA